MDGRGVEAKRIMEPFSKSVAQLSEFHSQPSLLATIVILSMNFSLAAADNYTPHREGGRKIGNSNMCLHLNLMILNS